MANQNDSFIDEVTEDLRRDRLFAAMRRYGWMVALLILIIVAGAAWREWSATRAEARAQAFGEVVLAALDAPDPAAALAAVDTGGSPERAALTALLAADARLAAGDRDGAAAALEALAADGRAPARDRDLARLKVVTLRGAAMDPAERDRALTELSAPGAPFRLLALEQKAVALAEAGRRDDAVALIGQIQQEQGLSDNLRERLAALKITLGAEDPPADAPFAPLPPTTPLPAAPPAPAD